MSAPTRPERGRLVSAVACERKVRVLVTVVDGPARELVRRHELGPSARRLAAEGLAAASLLSGQMKGSERLSIQIRGVEPSFILDVDLYGDGALRASFSPPELEDRPDNLVSGHIAVQKFVENTQVYQGVSSIDDETLEAALQRYFASSVQADGRVRVLAGLDPEGRVEFAAAMLVERYPDMPEDDFAALFDAPMRRDFRSLMTAFAFGELAGSELELLDARDLVYRCPCSLERVKDMLVMLGALEIDALIAEHGQAEVQCHFCNERYVVDGDALLALRAQVAEQIPSEH